MFAFLTTSLLSTSAQREMPGKGRESIRVVLSIHRLCETCTEQSRSYVASTTSGTVKYCEEQKQRFNVACSSVQKSVKMKLQHHVWHESI